MNTKWKKEYCEKHKVRIEIRLFIYFFKIIFGKNIMELTLYVRSLILK